MKKDKEKLTRAMRGFSVLVDDVVAESVIKRINKVMNNYEQKIKDLERICCDKDREILRLQNK